MAMEMEKYMALYKLSCHCYILFRYSNSLQFSFTKHLKKKRVAQTVLTQLMQTLKGLSGNSRVLIYPNHKGFLGFVLEKFSSPVGR